MPSATQIPLTRPGLKTRPASPARGEASCFIPVKCYETRNSLVFGYAGSLGFAKTNKKEDRNVSSSASEREEIRNAGMVIWRRWRG